MKSRLKILVFSEFPQFTYTDICAKNKFSVLPRESRDQGVQVSGDSEDAYSTTPTQTVDIKASWCQEIFSSNIRDNSTRAPPKSNISRNQTTVTREDNKNITPSHKSSSSCDVNQKAINIKKSILAKSYYCTTSSQEFEVTVANSLTAATILQRPPNHDVPRASQTLRPMEKLLSLSPKPKDGPATGDDGRSVGAEMKQITTNRKPCLRAELNLDLTQQKIFIFGGIDPYARRDQGDGHGKDVLYYDGCDNAWKCLANMPGSRHHHSAAVFRNRIYVIGGTRPAVYGSMKSIFEASVWSFDPKRLEWHNECHLPQPRRDFGLIAYDNDAAGDNKLVETGPGHCDRNRENRSGLYIVGGESIDGTPLSSTLFYDVEGKQWFEVGLRDSFILRFTYLPGGGYLLVQKASLNLGRYGLAATVVVNKKNNNAEIWIAGGVCGEERAGVPMITDSVEFYSLSDDDAIWKKSFKILRIPRLFARFCTAGGGKDLYIIGGISKNMHSYGEFSSISSVDFYDFQKQDWVHLTDMITSRHGHDVATVSDKILVFGGVCSDDRETLKSVECYSTKTGRWLYHVACLPTPLSGLAAAVIDCDM